MKTAIYTLGCKANQADSDELAMKLAEAGFEVVSYKEMADLYIVNTCTVTGKAAYQSRQAVRRFVKHHPGAKVVVMGCDVELEREALSGIDGVAGVFGNSERAKLVDVVNRLQTSDCRYQTFIPLKKGVCGLRSEVLSLKPVKRSRPFLKIQDGCESNCSYCIVPKVRGGLRSEPADLIVEKIESLHKQGYHEVVLTGIHIGKYGSDGRGSSVLGLRFNLTDLLSEILTRTHISRIRLSSIEPDEIDSRLIDLIANSGGRICPHLHIPLQSGCDETLRRMNRRYTTQRYRKCIENIKARMPAANIGADIITGFPGESEEEFEKTYSFIESLPVTYLHVFSYSDRKGTEATKMPAKINEDVKKKRTARLRALSTQKRTDYLKSNISREVTVVFDNKKSDVCSLKSEVHKGTSENYITVLVDGVRNQAVRVGRIRLTDICGESMVGVMAENEIQSLKFKVQNKPKAPNPKNNCL